MTGGKNATEDDIRANDTDHKEQNLYIFDEEQETRQLIEILTQTTEEGAAEALLQRLGRILNRYLECPTLLDATLEENIQVLSQSVLQKPSVAHPELQALYALSKVRGIKVVQRFVPHQVDALAAIWKTLQESQATPWESRYVLWYWMATLSLVPFDVHVMMDTHEFVVSLLRLTYEALKDPGPVREAAAVCVASWLARPDLEQQYLPTFVEWCSPILQNYTSRNIYQVLGILQALNQLHRTSLSRDRLVTLLDPLWDTLLSLARHDNLLLRKALIKFWGRLTCARLPQRLAPWRYRRGQRRLLDNLSHKKKIREDTHDNDDQYDTRDDSLPFVSDRVEEAMGLLLCALEHTSSVVRWSAAKGVARVTERLPYLCSEDVLDAILNFFDRRDYDQLWHGACLTLAELARRGLIVPSRLDNVIPRLAHAIQYDVRRGASSVGAHVRDAACYTYWALARAYSPQVMKPYIGKLSEAIILTSIFDREVNCRRAASAAFQEAVGRQGATSVPHGIEIVQTANYFSLGNRTDSYRRIARIIAFFEEYSRPILVHLCEVKTKHWDASIRLLGSKALYDITPIDPAFVANECIPKLFEQCLDTKDIVARHGAVHAVAEMLLSLSEAGALDLLSDETTSTFVSLVPEIERRRLYRGRGGEIMRSAVCRLVQCISLAKLPLAVKGQVRLLDSVDSSIPHPSESIQAVACDALSALLSSYFPVGEKGPSQRLQLRVVDKFVDKVRKEENPAATRGYCMALGLLPPKLLAPTSVVLDKIIAALVDASRSSALVGGEGDAETRRNALKALSCMAKSLSFPLSTSSSYPCVQLSEAQVVTIVSAELAALDDYKTDRRGDIGSWCRIAGMESLSILLPLYGEYVDAVLARRIVAAMLQQLAERLDTVREAAGQALAIILAIPSLAEKIPRSTELSSVLTGAANAKPIAGSDASVAYDKVVSAAISARAFEEEDYHRAIMKGLIVSIGGLTESVSKHSLRALLHYAAFLRTESDIDVTIGASIVNLMTRETDDARTMLASLKALTRLLCTRKLDDVTWGTGLVDLLEHESTTDVRRLLLVVDITTSLLSLSRPVPCWHLWGRLLEHSYPRVRSYAAEQLYGVLLQNPTREAYLLDLVLETPWSCHDRAAWFERAQTVTRMLVSQDESASAT